MILACQMQDPRPFGQLKHAKSMLKAASRGSFQREIWLGRRPLPQEQLDCDERECVATWASDSTFSWYESHFEAFCRDSGEGQDGGERSSLCSAGAS